MSGGTEPVDAESSVLTQTAEGSTTRKERATQFFSDFVATPLRILWSDWRARLGGSIVLSYLLMGTIAVWLTSAPEHMGGPTGLRWLQNWHYPFGTDSYGRGLWMSIVHATPAMLKMALGGGLFAVVVGVFIGTYAGFKGGNADKIMMVFTDIFLTIPGLPLVIVLVSLFNPQSPLVIGILLAINNWPGLARTIRSQVLTIREEAYVEASRATGMRTRTILGRDIIPQLMPYISINYMNATRGIIAESVGLYFIGLLPYSSLNWGVLLNQAYGIGLLSNPGNWYRLIIPLITIVGFSLGLILLAQALDRIFNPRVRARHSETTPDTEEEEIESGGGPTMGPGI